MTMNMKRTPKYGVSLQDSCARAVGLMLLMAAAHISLAAGLMVSAMTPATVDLSAYTNGAVMVTSPDTNTLVVNWTSKLGDKYRVLFNLTPGQALLRSLDTAPGSGGAFSAVMTNVDPQYRIQVGTRFMKAGWPYIFFDKVDVNTPAPVAYLSKLTPQTVRVISER